MSGVDWIKEQEKLRIFRVTNLKRHLEKKELYKPPIEVRTKKVGERNGFKIYLVDGPKVRKFVDYDFTMGGHGLRYIYVPMDEIWIDNCNRKEKEEIIAHEMHEFNLMKKKVNYNDAHDSASEKEIELRHKNIVLPVGHMRQHNGYSCGPYALKIVLDYHEDELGIREIMRLTKCTHEGTLHKDLKQALKKLKWDYIEKDDASIEEIESFIRKGLPVIVDYQDHYIGRRQKDESHFAVVIGYNERSLVLSDPALDTQYKMISKRKFKKLWFGEDKPGKIIKRWLLTIY